MGLAEVEAPKEVEAEAVVAIEVAEAAKVETVVAKVKVVVDAAVDKMITAMLRVTKIIWSMLSSRFGFNIRSAFFYISTLQIDCSRVCGAETADNDAITVVDNHWCGFIPWVDWTVG